MKIDVKIEKILEKIAKSGFEVAIVGGAVRDLLNGKNPSDWDFATNAKPEEIQKLFKNSFYNNKFGTVGIPIDDETIIQITTYRSEEKYSDKRHPDVIKWGKSLAEDLKRRDFTINAMGLIYQRSKIKDQNLELVDPFDGQADLKNKLLRSVGDPNERFSEDALRLLRAIRFATILDFKIEPKTLAEIKKNADLLSKISGERIREELFKIIGSNKPADGIMLARDAGLLKIFLPELENCFAVEQKSPKRHHIFDVGTHNVMSLANCPSSDTITRFATLLHDIGKAKVAKVTQEGVRTFYNHEVVGGRMVLLIAKRLQLSREQRDKLFKLVRFHQFTVNENQTDKALRRFIRNIGVDYIEDMMDLRVGDRLGGGLQQPEGWRLKLFRQRLKEVMKKPFTVKDLKIDGNDVMKTLNIKPGPEVGKILKALFEEVADDKVKNTKEYLIGQLKKHGKNSP